MIKHPKRTGLEKTHLDRIKVTYNKSQPASSWIKKNSEQPHSIQEQTGLAPVLCNVMLEAQERVV